MGTCSPSTAESTDMLGVSTPSPMMKPTPMTTSTRNTRWYTMDACVLVCKSIAYVPTQQTRNESDMQQCLHLYARTPAGGLELHPQAGCFGLVILGCEPYV